MRGARKMHFAAIPLLAAIATIAAGCGSSGDADASTTASAIATTSSAETSTAESPAPSSDAPAPQSPGQGSDQDADVPAPLIQAGAPCPGINAIGVDSATGAAELVCAAGPDGPTWGDAPAVKIRAIGEPCEPKLEAVAWSTAGVELMCVDQEWVLTQ